MKILVRATNWVGDAIMALPAIRAVRASFPEPHIALWLGPESRKFIEGRKFATNLSLTTLKESTQAWPVASDLARELRGQKFDVALFLQNAFDAAWLAWRAGIPERIGYARDGRSLLLTKPSRYPSPAKFQLTNSFTISNCCGAPDGSTPQPASPTSL